MQIIIGYGNSLRGEDAFGIDVIRGLEKTPLKNTKILEAYQLSPELCLDLLKAKKIVFIDAAFSKTNHYALACDIQIKGQTNLSHHISPQVIISILNNVYKKYPKYEIYSMFTNDFDEIKDKQKYKNCINNICEFLILTNNK